MTGVSVRWHGAFQRRVWPAPPSSLSATSKWTIGLTALIGAWCAHFVEYVRVAGWHDGLAEMSSSVHTYFFPAGAALTAVILMVGLAARRLWARLGARLNAAEAGLWTRPRAIPAASSPVSHGPMSVARLWLMLLCLQTTTWIAQENLEAIGAGHRAPMFGVVSGAHWLAPVVEAEVALILAAAYCLIDQWFARRRTRVVNLERLVARRWNGWCAPALQGARAAAICLTPLQRWGRQLWARPPPQLALTV